jgi:predicted alternative tryptophan synthase beta-subunit
MNSETKPPIGLRPEYVHEYHAERDRLIEIAEAMKRYAEAGKPVPIKWANELERRILNYTLPTRGNDA